MCNITSEVTVTDCTSNQVNFKIPKERQCWVFTILNERYHQYLTGDALGAVDTIICLLHCGVLSRCEKLFQLEPMDIVRPNQICYLAYEMLQQSNTYNLQDYSTPISNRYKNGASNYSSPFAPKFGK